MLRREQGQGTHLGLQLDCVTTLHPLKIVTAAASLVPNSCKSLVEVLDELGQ